MFTRKRRLPNSKKKRQWYFLALPLLIILGGIGIFMHGFFTPKQFVSALPEKSALSATTSITSNSLQKAFETAGLQVDTIESASGSAYFVHLHSGETIVADDTTPISTITSLQELLTNLTMEGKRIDRLDLRFEKPVVLFKK